MTENRHYQVVILAGGQGTRLRARTGDLPKPMVPVLGRPLLEHQVELCRAHGFTDIVMLLHYRPQAVIDHFGDGSAWGVRLGYEIEAVPRGTAGALRDVLPRLDSRFLVLYGDTFVDVDLRALWNAHLAHSADATLVLHPNDHPQDSDLVALAADGFVRGIFPYPHAPDAVLHNQVNAALYVMERDGLARHVPEQGLSDIAKHLFPALLADGRRLYGHVTPEYIKDCGTPERLDKIERDINNGTVDRLSARALRSAVFLDRDGTINREVDHLRDAAQLELLPGAAEAIRRINRAGRLAVVVTNQPVLARGDLTEAGLDRIHAKLESLLGASGAFLDRIYVCPHHPERGFASEVPALKIDCACRKPSIGLIEQARRELGIGSNTSWMVGDSTADIEAARRAGLRSVLVRTGHAGRDDKQPLRPDYTAPDLAAATDWILHGHAQMSRRLAPLAAACTSGVRSVLVGGLSHAGKSSAAQVLKELLAALGVTAHVIGLDSWLRPGADRPEGQGVLQRYDMAEAERVLGDLARSAQRVTLDTLVHDRKARVMHRHPLRHSIGPDDVLIVEGVTALLSEPLLQLAQLRLYVETPEPQRLDRLRADYAWRGVDATEIERRLVARAVDEQPVVVAARERAQHIISSGAPA
ncbi:HAD-IIIA family hydrolase [Rhizobacter sp. SG703]|uniref:HAD-IIIA family hydrolase n=1 Tax=Rhizobacter sp. SG703 TaxID=2587140 RepID=UPI001448A180|nr:HAD-IIIA family hydrolase [Rhizobacter sp. SG703]NKI95075.1 histidinol-phosphate phosphatase family protein [Rhizobacter sp. SG703]